MSIKDGRIESIKELKSVRKDKPDFTIRAKPLDQYPGKTEDERIQQQLRDVGNQQADAIKNNPNFKTIHVHVSEETYSKIVNTLNDARHKSRADQFNALNRLMGVPSYDRVGGDDTGRGVADERDSRHNERDQRGRAERSSDRQERSPAGMRQDGRAR